MIVVSYGEQRWKSTRHGRSSEFAIKRRSGQHDEATVGFSIHGESARAGVGIAFLDTGVWSPWLRGDSRDVTQNALAGRMVQWGT